MSAQEKIGKLQGLLERIKRNSTLPRVAAARPPAAAAVAAAAPPAPSPADQSVDDLLDASPQPSPIPVEVDVTLDSVPPAEAQPIPLVTVAGGAPPAEDTANLDSEVSEVRVATGPREPSVEVTVASIEAEAEVTGTEELSEEDLVELTDVTETTSVPPPVTTDVDIDFEDEEEQPPASSQRSRVASSMDEALAGAAEQLEADREVPIKTPPPESGPQEAPLPAGISAPAAPDVDALLNQELDIPTHAEDRIPAAAVGPTPEQLGQTIDLEEARGPALELAEPKASELPGPAPVEELEVALPGREVVGGYHDNLQPPPEAREDLEAHRRRLEDELQPGPEVVARPVPAGAPATFGAAREGFRPGSFTELLDASLALRGD